MDETDTISRRTLRLPQAEASFIAAAARRNLTSENAEIVRSIRERMQTTAGGSLQADTPAVVPSGPDCTPTQQPT